MSDPFVGEIRPVAFGYPPAGWAACDGTLLPISGNEALFALIGTTYGGDGNTSFALPNLLSRTAVDVGSATGFTVTLGLATGVESVSLQGPQVGSHNHALNTGPTGTTNVPNGATVLADEGGINPIGPTPQAYGQPTSLVAMSNKSISPAGGTTPHENRQPFQAINFIISLQGIYPQFP